MRFIILVLLCSGLFAWNMAAAAETERPNILWISCEDISPHLGCYGDRLACTPTLDQLAAEGVRYTHAFSCHGVCAPSRTGIITGMYPISLGANHMRSRVSLPGHIRCFPEHLRESGYYCSNNSKTDYNLMLDLTRVWDESSATAHWRNRKMPDQPFFAVFNFTMTHESRNWPENWKKVVDDLPPDQLHSPESMVVPPLYPDTPEVRRALARQLDTITVLDQNVAALLQQLHDDGLSENTIVFFWSDHGDCFPRAKRWIYDSGTRVPLIVRVPERWRSPGWGTPETVDNRLVNLIDLGPTVLTLAGVPVPDGLHGQSMKGSNQTAPRSYIFGARDRIDERPDLVRSVRDRRYRYVRHLMPWLPAFQHLSYAEKGAVRQEMRRLYQQKLLPPESARYFEIPRAAEELFDLTQDPWELNNLATDPEMMKNPELQAKLAELRDACDQWQLECADAHLIPEAILDEEGQAAGSRWQLYGGSGGKSKPTHPPDRFKRLLKLAKMAAGIGTVDDQFLRAALDDDDPTARWWAVCGLTQNHRLFTDDHREILSHAAHDQSLMVRIAAIAGLLRSGEDSQVQEIFESTLRNESPFVRHAALIELDAAGLPIIKASRSLLEQLPEEEYGGRVAAHVMSRLTGTTAP